jgi:YggT family protein
MIILLAQIISFIFRALQFIVLVDVVLSYFMSPYQPVRQALDRIVNPMLAPIRRLLPSAGGIDFSPMVLLIVLVVLENIVSRLLFSIG